MAARFTPFRRLSPLLCAFVLFSALAAVHTWPLAAAPAHWSRVDGADPSLNIWAINWVGHQLWNDPRHLFDANIFYPEKLTLAYSEAMLVQSVIAMPAVALGGSPVLGYNLALLAGFALTGFAFCWLVRHWTGSWSAGVVAGSLAAFNATNLVGLGHLQFRHTEFFALMLFAFDRLVATRAWTSVAWLAIGFALQSLTSIYLMVFSVWTMAFAAAARSGEWGRTHAAATLVRLAAAAAIAAIVLAPYLVPYFRVRATMGFSRGVEEQAAASWRDYLATGARLHYQTWSRSAGDGATMFAFPGLVAVGLIVVAVRDARTRQDARFRMAAVVGVGSLVVSMAPRLPFYPALHDAIPLFQALRVPARLGLIVLLMVAVLAGFGVAALQRRLAGRWWPAVALALVIAVNAEAMRAPMGLTWFEGVPGVYDVLAADSRAVVVEIPFPMPQQWFLNAPYMVNSTRHGRPMLNGYSGFRPPSYETWYEAARGFPADESLMRLYGLGVTHVVVHANALGEERLASLANIHNLQFITRDDEVIIYRLLAP